jgi:putative transposase
MVAGVTGQVQVSAGGVCDLRDNVVCWKYRRPVLAGRNEELMRTKAAGRGWRMVALEIVPDRVQLRVKAHQSEVPSPITRQVIGFTAWLRAVLPDLRSWLPILWSRWFCEVRAGVASASAVRRYTGTQNGRSWRKERTR